MSIPLTSVIAFLVFSSSPEAVLQEKSQIDWRGRFGWVRIISLRRFASADPGIRRELPVLPTGTCRDLPYMAA